MSKSSSTGDGDPERKQPVGALLLQVMTSLSLLDVPTASSNSESTLFVSKNKFAASARRNTIRGQHSNSTGYSSDASQDSSVSKSMRRSSEPPSPHRDRELPSLVKNQNQMQAQQMREDNPPKELRSALSASQISDALEANRDFGEELGGGLRSKSLGQGERERERERVRGSKYSMEMYSSNTSIVPSTSNSRINSRNSSALSSPARSRQSSSRDLTMLCPSTSNVPILSPVNSRGRSMLQSQSTKVSGTGSGTGGGTLDPAELRSALRSDLDDAESKVWNARSKVLTPIPSSPDSTNDPIGEQEQEQGVLSGLRTMPPPFGSKSAMDTLLTKTERKPSVRRGSFTLPKQMLLSLPKGSLSAVVERRKGLPKDKDKERERERERERDVVIASTILDDPNSKRHFWSKSVILVCVQQYLRRKSSAELNRRKQARMRFRATCMLLKACLRFRSRRYTALERRMKALHGNAVVFLRKVVRVWREKRATLRIRDFLTVCLKCKAHPHGMSTQFLRKYLHAVKIVQAATRDFLKRTKEYMKTLEKIWDTYELQYINSTVKALRAQAQRFLSAVNTPMGQGQGQHGLFSHSVSMSFKDSRDSSSNNLMRDMRESRDMRDNFNSGISSMRSVSSNNFSTASPSHSSASTPRKRVPDILPLPFMSSASTSSFSPSPSASSSSYTSPSSFPSQLSLGTSSLTASSGNHVGYEGERRNAYFKSMELALEHRRATIDMTIKRHGRVFDASNYLVPRATKMMQLTSLIKSARVQLSSRYKESLRLQHEWTAEVTVYSTADALKLVQSDNQDSLLSMVRYKMNRSADKAQEREYEPGSKYKKRLPFVFFKLRVLDADVHRCVRESHDNKSTFETIENQCAD